MCLAARHLASRAVIGEPENRRFDSPPCRPRGGPTTSSHPRTEEARPSQRHPSCRRHETAAAPRFAPVFVCPGRLAFTALCARRRPASRHWSPTAIGRREPVGDGPLDFACARARRHPRPQALRASRRRFATADRITRWPNRWFADGGGTPGGGRVVSTGAAGRGCHADCPRPAPAGSRRPRCSEADGPAGSGRTPNFRTAFA